MPYIDVKTNIKLTKEKDLLFKSEIANILASSFPGKTENWLMISITDGLSMFFAGKDEPCMIMSISIFGKQSDTKYDKMTAASCDFINKEFGIPKDRIYIKYDEISHWGWNGTNF